ncbi:sulfide:quinone oxidoreductase, mitochondrial-like [Lineus longissimus]|uniref:sulfide:quinone oxidoreductase, mitochondrial-like n=1 Tax=Lineus longissimus TaxID=88925 RepID=UPI002B4F9ADE
MLSNCLLKFGVLRPLGCQIGQFRGAHTPVGSPQKGYKVVVVGGGAGGCSTAARLCRQVGKGNVAVIEPADYHYYQPMFTLVGSGIKKLENTQHPMSEVLPSNCDWVKDKVTAFDPENNTVTTQDGHKINYDYLVVSVGLQLNYNKIKGLEEALASDPMVASNYSPMYVNKTYNAMRSFKEGNAIFTFPNTPIKCAGAPQKIMYLTEEYLRTSGKRDKSKIMFNSPLGVLFGVKKYADALWKVVEKRGIDINLKQNLVEIRADKKEAVFEKLDSESKEKVTYPYEMIHVTPPMSTPDVLQQSPLVNEAGFVTVNKLNMQHTKYPNVFGLGDCTDIPTAKTAAAIASQNAILANSFKAVMNGQKPTGNYNGYTSCPLITSRSTCILAEFDFDGQPLETFPIDQGVERTTMYHLKKDVMPEVYWKMLLNGRWAGPDLARKLMHLGTGK